jgi:hypothetical protein
MRHVNPQEGAGWAPNLVWMYWNLGYLTLGERWKGGWTNCMVLLKDKRKGRMMLRIVFDRCHEQRTGTGHDRCLTRSSGISVRTQKVGGLGSEMHHWKLVLDSRRKLRQTHKSVTGSMRFEGLSYPEQVEYRGVGRPCPEATSWILQRFLNEASTKS